MVRRGTLRCANPCHARHNRLSRRPALRYHHVHKNEQSKKRVDMMSRSAILAGVFVMLIPACGGAAGLIDTSPRPQERGSTSVTETRAFQAWVNDFRPRAMREGISGDTFDRAFRNVRFNTGVIERDRNQGEFTRAIWDYLDSAVSDRRVENGRAALADHRDVLAAIEARYGVAPEVVVAVWGVESSYGDYRGDTAIIEALATLAHEGRRGAFFEEQLIGALRIIQDGDVAPEDMTGSWAGAMGHTQFIPTSYLSYAVDFRGTGERDIWSDDPTDALASTASYLAEHGWTRDQPWGVEIDLPSGLEGRQGRRPVADWRADGVTLADGSTLPDHGTAKLFQPAGVAGPAFLTFANFDVIKRYNPADAYAMAIGHLADRIGGAGDFNGAWPRDHRPLTGDERRELQERLTARGFDTQGIDGRVGPNTVAAVRAFQTAEGMAPDGYVSHDLLERLR